jgi:hypothetical protein
LPFSKSRVKAAIIAQLQLGDIEVKILFADFMEGAHDAVLGQPALCL